MKIWVFLNYFRIFVTKSCEVTASRQKKRIEFFVLLSTFRNFVTT